MIVTTSSPVISSKYWSQLKKLNIYSDDWIQFLIKYIKDNLKFYREFFEISSDCLDIIVISFVYWEIINILQELYSISLSPTNDKQIFWTYENIIGHPALKLGLVRFIDNKTLSKILFEEIAKKAKQNVFDALLYKIPWIRSMIKKIDDEIINRSAKSLELNTNLILTEKWAAFLNEYLIAIWENPIFIKT